MRYTTLTRNFLVVLFCLSLFAELFLYSQKAFAADNNNTEIRMVDRNAVSPPTVYKYYQEANASETNVSKYNTKDWQNHFETNGLTGTSLIGNTMSLFGTMQEGKIATNGNLEDLKTSNLQKSLPNNKSLGAFSAVDKSVMINGTSNQMFGNDWGTGKNIKCFITRDIGQSYMCTAPDNSLVVSSSMGGKDSLSKLKSDCEGQCYVQNSCTNMSLTDVNMTETPPQNSFSLSNSSPSYTFVIPVANNTLTLRYIDFNETSKGANIVYSISYKDYLGNNRKLVENLISYGDKLNRYSLFIGDIVSSITITVSLKPDYTGAINTNIILDNFNLAFASNAKWVCPSVQDVSNYTPGQFANQCVSGKKITLSNTYNGISKTITLCTGARYNGQNADGSFYQQSACESICRVRYGCTLLSGGAINYEGLKGFREGCIENSGGTCSNISEDCKKARTNPNVKVVNEIVFGANSSAQNTIINGVTTPVARPRLSITEDSSATTGVYSPNDTQFETQKKEEWKDLAYGDMVSNAMWNVSKVGIGQDTEPQSAYGINLKNGAGYGFSNTSIRSLIWKFKPSALSVGTGSSKYLYAVIRAVVQNYRYDQTASTTNKVPYYDEIWYVKTSSSDTFNAFYYKKDAYTIEGQADNNNPLLELITQTFTPKANTIGNFSTFAGNNWVDISPSNQSEFFVSDNFSNADSAFKEYEIMGDMDNKYNYLPGLIKSITQSNNIDIYNYSGAIDFSTASSVVKFTVYTGLSNTPLSYSELKDAADNQTTLHAIYETGNEKAYPRTFQGDGEKDNNIALYLYGPNNNASAYFNIKPRADHVGKKGFIFIFAK
ncbi:MAG: hypothetical protein PHE67_00715 [Campylobacterales bacterium]|nr:hypothetical protein [Campylobacterales bacterium]